MFYNPPIDTNAWRRLWLVLRDVGIETAYLLPAVAMIFVSVVPAESLAFVNDVELAHQPLRFVRDPSLNETAVVGIEAFPAHRSAGGLLNSRSSRIPDAVGPVVPGMAIRVLATAYSSTVDQTDGNPFITASGTRVHRGTMAANFLPFGTQVRIGNSEYTVLDRMNSRYNGKYIVDLWFPSRGEAIQFGVQVIEMEIISLPQQ